MISNCFIEAFKKRVKLKGSKLYIATNTGEEFGIKHFLWSADGKLYHFTYDKSKNMDKWWKFILFNGKIKEFDVKHFNKYKLRFLF